MTQVPGSSDFEARLSAQEHTTAMLQARVEELSRNVTVSFQQQAKYQGVIERELELRFKHIDTRFDKVDARLDSVDARMATKEDIVSLESRIGGLEQRFTSLENKTDQRFISLEQRFNSLDSKFDSVLQLLTVLTKKIVE